MEEPICEPPAVALYYVSKLASRHVKVLISGEGGDEAFAGYQNYRNIMWLERAKQLGWPVTRGLAGVVGAIGRAAGVKRAKKYSVLMKTPIEDYYYGRTWNPLSSFQRLQLCTRPERRWPSAGSAVLIKELFNKVAQENTLNRMLYVDSKTWLPDDLLVKADKMTMANSVELRVPFLDHRVLEFAAHLPENTKVRGFTTKYILKKAFEGRVPGKILNRPKTGFPVPYEKWLQEDLRGPVSDILRDRRTVERGYFDAAAVEGLLVDSAIRTASAAEIFSLVTMELWHRQFVDARN
jgi:asparagine synthase (glutamine-hydrolysing)